MNPKKDQYTRALKAYVALGYMAAEQEKALDPEIKVPAYVKKILAETAVEYGLADPKIVGMIVMSRLLPYLQGEQVFNGEESNYKEIGYGKDVYNKELSKKDTPLGFGSLLEVISL
ncbi:hypothetical protein ACFL0V_03700 [Nanoarchaeota archaeon]